MIRPAVVIVSALLCCVLSTGLAVGAEHNQLSEKELADGWIRLFDGKTLFGWKAGSEANWRVEDGTITVDSGKGGLLATTTEFADYVLKIDFRSPVKTNSGIFLHTPPQPTSAAVDCYELNIAPPESSGFPTGSLVARKKATPVKITDQWRSYEITMQGDQVTIVLDGREVLSYTDPKPLLRGAIGLQLNSGKVSFRNIKLKPLGTKSIFNGKDLTGWKTDQAQKSVFSVTKKGEMNVKNGRGQIETEGKYGDFVLQMEAFSNGKHLNSGIFFRCIPGDFQMGYESQIQNGFKDGDRTKPLDCGTGGIFRRQNARFVVPDDFKWFHKTIIADGAHMAVWVNGTQVSDWTDEREAHENPRKGKRTEAGTVIIQGHDPTTDLSFRGFRVVELPSRGQGG